MQEPEPTANIKRLVAAGMTETQIADELTSIGVPVTQPTINRIKKGSGTSYEIGMALRTLVQSRVRSKRSALNA